MRFAPGSPRIRRGMAVLEVVIITGLALPLAAGVFWLIVLVVKRFFGMLGTGVGMPYL